MQNETNINVVETGDLATSGCNTSNPIITVVRDPQHSLGKRFTINQDSTVSKQSSVNVSFGIAIMRRVETHAELAALLAKVGDDPHAAIINASFDGIEIGEEFVIASERRLEELAGIPATDRARQKGIHKIDHDGKSLKAVGRFKENVHPSSWQLLDRDIDQHTPEKFTLLSVPNWLSELAKIIPGVDKVTRVF